MTAHVDQVSAPLWFDTIPKRWRLERGKTLFTKLNRPVEAGDETVTVFRDGTVTLRSNRRTTGFTEALQEIGYQGIRLGDLAIHAMDAFAGAVGVSDSDGKCSPVVAVCRSTSDANPHYFAHVVREMARTQWIKALAKGIRERSTDFRFETFADQYYPLPPLDEQRAIARFLDRKSRRIARFIHARQRMIALLNEQKQAIIHQAVTRGLDPDVPLKPSGIDWLGDIPAHWTIGRLKECTDQVVDCLHATPIYVDDGVPAIRTADISPGAVRTISAKRIAESDYVRWTARLEPREGDILYSREGERFGIAALVPPDTKLCISQRMMILRLKPDNDPEYFMWQLNAPHVYAQAAIDTIGSAAPHVNISTIREYVLLVPPLHEQQAICSYIRLEQSAWSSLILRAEREIELLREYRTRLIADVVTGKLEIRDHPDAAENALDDLDDVSEFDAMPGTTDGSDALDGILDAEVAVEDADDERIVDAAG